MMRRHRFAILVAIIVLAFGAIALNRLRQDTTRLTGWLVSLVADTTGLVLDPQAPGRFSFWPELRLGFDSVALRDGETTLAVVDGLDVSIPWSTLRGGPVQVGAISVDRIDLHAGPSQAWFARRYSADAGPPQPWTWPRLAQPVAIGQLRWFSAGDDTTPAFAVADLRIDRWMPGSVASLQASVSVQPEVAPVRVALVATPAQDGIDLVLAPFALALDPGVVDAEASGRFSFNHLGQGRFDGTIAARDLSPRFGADWLDLDRPSRLEVGWRGTFDGAFRLRANGSLFGEALEADVGLPVDWRDHATPPMALLDVLEGKATITRLRIGASEWNRLSVEGHPFADEGAPPTAP